MKPRSRKRIVRVSPAPTADMAVLAPDLEIARVEGVWVLQARGADDAISWHESLPAARAAGRAVAAARGVQLWIAESALPDAPSVERDADDGVTA